MRVELVISVGACVLVTACGGAQPEAAPPSASTAAPVASTPPVTTAAAAEVPAPVATTVTAPVVNANDSDEGGVRRWKSWDGPTSGAKITSKRAWVFAPNMHSSGETRASFAAVVLTNVEVVRADDKEVVAKEQGGEYAVPNALARPADGKGVKKGSYALCAFGGSNVVGRIDAVDAKGATCTLRFMDSVRKEKLRADEALPLAGNPGGSPIAVMLDNEMYLGTLIASDATNAWVTVDTQFSSGPRANKVTHKVAKSDVTFLDPSRELKAGAAVLAPNFGALGPGSVTKVVDGGLAYEVKLEGGSTKIFDVTKVVPAKGDAKKTK